MKHVIIGNGPAGVVAAETIRKADPQAVITLIGDEPEAPYSRMAIPYLLNNGIQEEGTYLRKGGGHFERLRIGLMHARVRALDTQARSLKLDDGGSVPYERLLIATGSHPVRPPIPGIDLPDVHPCWTLADARQIIAKSPAGTRVLQIGAGFIGCIIMESLAERGVRLTVVEMGDRMVPRMMTPSAGGLIKKWVEKQGVRVHTQTQVESIRAGSGPEAGTLVAKLGSGDELVANLVIASAGVRPNVGFLQGSGIECDIGVLVDETLQTNVPGVYAAGDVAEAMDFNTGKPLVNAIQPNAADQARVAALNMAGKRAVSQGTMAINVLDTLGLVSSSFGQWWGDIRGQSVEASDDERFKYISLQFLDDVLIGATSIGLTEHVGVLRGLIQTKTHLGEWKENLLRDPTRVMEAYLARAQDQAGWAMAG